MKKCKEEKLILLLVTHEKSFDLNSQSKIYIGAKLLESIHRSGQKRNSVQARTQDFSFAGWRGGADPKATYNLCLIFLDYVIKIMLQVQHNTACNCIYIHTKTTTCSMTQSQCPILLVFFY
jgi:hypothetical protein